MERNLFRKLAIAFIIIQTTACLTTELNAEYTAEEYFLDYKEENASSNDKNFQDEELTNLMESQNNNEEINQNTIAAFPLVMNDFVQAEIEYLTGPKRSFLITALKRAEDYVASMRLILEEAGLPKELVYLPIIESGFNYHAYSRVGAAGMWQFMPRTDTWIGMKRNDWVDERLDPLISCKYAAIYLKELYNFFQDWNLALASYNYGRGNVSSAIKRANTSDYYEIISKNIIPMETRKYVPRLNAVIHIMNNLEEYGLEFNEKTAEFEYVDLTLLFHCGLWHKKRV